MKKAFQEYRHLLEKKGNLQEKISDHINLIEKFYAEHIVQIENSAPPIEGKLALKNMEIKNLQGVHAVETTIQNYVIEESAGIVWGEMSIRFHSKKSGKTRIEEAFFQKWKNGQITYQRFYYGPFLKED